MVQIRKMVMISILVLITGMVSAQTTEEIMNTLKEMLGKPAPEFTLKDVNFNDFSLSSLRGKYVVLDFWGTWCSGCIKAFPKLKEFYVTGRGEFEIVGIAVKTNLDAWREIVLEKHSLPWINVFDDVNLFQKYFDVSNNVFFSPMYIFIDTEGIIVNISPYFDDDGNVLVMWRKNS